MDTVTLPWLTGANDEDTLWENWTAVLEEEAEWLMYDSTLPADDHSLATRNNTAPPQSHSRHIPVTHLSKHEAF